MSQQIDREVVSGFVSQAKGFLPEIVLGLECFAGDPSKKDKIEDACGFSRKIGIAAAALGLDAIRRSAEDLCELLEMVGSGVFDIDENLLVELCQCVSDLADLLGAVDLTDYLPAIPTVPAEAYAWDNQDALLEVTTPEEVVKSYSAPEELLPELDCKVSNSDTTPALPDFSVSYPADLSTPTIGELEPEELTKDIQDKHAFEPTVSLPAFDIPAELGTTEEVEAFVPDPLIDESYVPSIGLNSFDDASIPHAGIEYGEPATPSLPEEEPFSWETVIQAMAPPAEAEDRTPLVGRKPANPAAPPPEPPPANFDGIKDRETGDPIPPDLLILEVAYPNGVVEEEVPQAEMSTAEEAADPQEITTALPDMMLDFGTLPEVEPPPAKLSVASGLMEIEAAEPAFSQTELNETFAEEAKEHFLIMHKAVAAMENAPQDKEALQRLRRSTHSLKGTSGMIGLHSIMHLLHRLEDLLDGLYEDTIRCTPRILCLMQETIALTEEMTRGNQWESLLVDIYEQFDEVIGKPSDKGKNQIEESEEPEEPIDQATLSAFQIDFPTLSEKDFSETKSQDIPMPVIEEPVVEENPKFAETPMIASHLESALEPLPVAVPQPVETQVSVPMTHALPSRERTKLSSRPIEAVAEDTGDTADHDFVKVPAGSLDQVVRLLSEMITTRTGFEDRISDLTRHIEDLLITGNRLKRASSVLERKIQGSASLRSRLGAGLTRSTGGSGKENSEAAAVNNSLISQELDRVVEMTLLSRDLAEASSDIQTLGRELAEINGHFVTHLNRQGRLYGDFQERLIRLRMQPFGSIAQRLHRAVRSVSSVVGKRIELMIEGESTTLDTTTLQTITDPLMHLIRNCIDHGIEPEEERVANGKLPHGRIGIRAYYEGSQVVIQAADDGRGLDTEKIRTIAVQRGLMSANEADSVSDHEIWSLIFSPGFTTAETVSEISGRGVGMDIVYDAVQRLKGSISVDSTTGEGTTVTIRLPLTLALTRALMVGASGQTFAIPIDLVTQVMRLDTKRIEMLGTEPVVKVGARLYPVLLLSRLLNLKNADDELNPNPPALILNVDGAEIILIVDELMGGREVVIKSLGDHLKRIHGVMGATLLGNGRVVLILNLSELLRGASRPIERKPQIANLTSSLPESDQTLLAAEDVSAPLVVQTAPVVTEPQPSRPVDTVQVLLVDDSPSVRRVGSGLIKSLGWNVVQAKDGLDAFEKLQSGAVTPNLIVLDIEMPRMDGFQLLSSLKTTATYRHIPIVIVSSRASEKHRQKALEMGAAEYITKPFNETQTASLLNKVLSR